MSPSSHPDARAVRVFAYFDYSCPHSYLALALLEATAAQVPLEIVWRPLEVRPADGPLAAEEDEASQETDWEELAERASELRLPLYRPAERPSTRLALQAGEFARDLGDEAHRRLHRAIFRAHFVRGLDIGRVDQLLDLAAEEGIDREALVLALEDGRYLDELARAEDEAERYDIRQTPTMLFGRFKVIGAAPVPLLLETAQRAAAE